MSAIEAGREETERRETGDIGGLKCALMNRVVHCMADPNHKQL